MDYLPQLQNPRRHLRSRRINAQGRVGPCKGRPTEYGVLKPYRNDTKWPASGPVRQYEKRSYAWVQFIDRGERSAATVKHGTTGTVHALNTYMIPWIATF